MGPRSGKLYLGRDMGTTYLKAFMVEGDKGVGALENRGLEGYGRWKERGWEAEFPKWREPDKRRNILQYCATFYNRKRPKKWEPLLEGVRSGSKRYGR